MFYEFLVKIISIARGFIVPGKACLQTVENSSREAYSTQESIRFNTKAFKQEVVKIFFIAFIILLCFVIALSLPCRVYAAATVVQTVLSALVGCAASWVASNAVGLGTAIAVAGFTPEIVFGVIGVFLIGACVDIACEGICNAVNKAYEAGAFDHFLNNLSAFELFGNTLICSSLIAFKNVYYWIMENIVEPLAPDKVETVVGSYRPLDCNQVLIQQCLFTGSDWVDGNTPLGSYDWITIDKLNNMYKTTVDVICVKSDGNAYEDYKVEVSEPTSDGYVWLYSFSFRFSKFNLYLNKPSNSHPWSMNLYLPYFTKSDTDVYTLSTVFQLDWQHSSQYIDGIANASNITYYDALNYPEGISLYYASTDYDGNDIYRGKVKPRDNNNLYFTCTTSDGEVKTHFKSVAEVLYYALNDSATLEIRDKTDSSNVVNIPTTTNKKTVTTKTENKYYSKDKDLLNTTANSIKEGIEAGTIDDTTAGTISTTITDAGKATTAEVSETTVITDVGTVTEVKADAIPADITVTVGPTNLNQATSMGSAYAMDKYRGFGDKLPFSAMKSISSFFSTAFGSDGSNDNVSAPTLHLNVNLPIIDFNKKYDISLSFLDPYINVVRVSIMIEFILSMYVAFKSWLVRKGGG